MAATKKGWSKPLKIITSYDLASLRGLIAKHAPIGKKRTGSIRSNKGRGSFTTPKTYTYANPPPAPGRLRKSFYKAGNVVLSKSGKSIIINSELPYARAQDTGARIPAYHIKPGASKMMFKSGGKAMFLESRRGFTLKGTGYVKAAFEEWKNRRGIKAPVKIRWAAYKGGSIGGTSRRVVVEEMKRAPGGI